MHCGGHYDYWWKFDGSGVWNAMRRMSKLYCKAGEGGGILNDKILEVPWLFSFLSTNGVHRILSLMLGASHTRYWYLVHTHTDGRYIIFFTGYICFDTIYLQPVCSIGSKIKSLSVKTKYIFLFKPRRSAINIWILSTVTACWHTYTWYRKSTGK